jgi:hypothetical protein
VAPASPNTGVGLAAPRLAFAGNVDEDGGGHAHGPGPRPIPGGVTPFIPFGIFVHHNPLNAAIPLADLKDPSQITDFNGFVGLTHIRGGGTGTADTGTPVDLAYQADMGFSKGRFVGFDGRRHEGTFAFV